MGYLAEAAYILAVCFFSHVLHKVLGVKPAVTRKLTHILIGFVFPIQYYFFREDAVGLLTIPLAVTVLLFLVARFRLVPSMVNPENPYGIFYYALSILVSNVIAILYPPYHAAAGAAIACLALGDGAAALLTAGLSRRHRLFRDKSVEGTLFCVAFSALGMLALGLLFPALALTPFTLIAAALLCGGIELLCGRLDNPAIVFGIGLFVALCRLSLSGGAVC